jgi:hypothetical protein
VSLELSLKEFLMKNLLLALLTGVCLIPCWGEGSALAADAESDDPIVNVAPSGGTFFDKPLPASSYFKLQFAPVGVAPSMMVARVWPYATFKGCKDVSIASLAGTKQFHEIAMLPNNDATHPAFVARIPPLQVGQRFCVSIESFVLLSDDLSAALVTSLANEVVAKLRADQSAQDKVRDAIVEGLNRHFKLRYGRELDDAEGVAGKAAELVDQQLISAFITATIKSQTAIDNPALKTALDAAQAALTTNVKSALANPAVTSAFKYQQVQSGVSLAGEGATASAANYAAIDTGVVAAFPLGYAGGNGNPWALPYIGLNLYFTPVDRTIPLSQLVNQAGQRLSLTIGRTLSDPTLPNRTISDFGFGYPVFAGGYRVSQFVRTTLGAVFYKINSENPTSTNTVFGVAPFVGMALDGDVIAIAQGKLFSPN